MKIRIKKIKQINQTVFLTAEIDGQEHTNYFQTIADFEKFTQRNADHLIREAVHRIVGDTFDFNRLAEIENMVIDV